MLTFIQCKEDEHDAVADTLEVIEILVDEFGIDCFEAEAMIKIATPSFPLILDNGTKIWSEL